MGNCFPHQGQKLLFGVSGCFLNLCDMAFVTVSNFSSQTSHGTSSFSGWFPTLCVLLSKLLLTPFLVLTWAWDLNKLKHELISPLKYIKYGLNHVFVAELKFVITWNALEIRFDQAISYYRMSTRMNLKTWLLKMNNIQDINSLRL